MKQHRRANKIPEPDDEGLAADRRERATWPVNDYVLGAALLLIGVIVLIAIAIFTGLVKP
jgi:hypothetical protein